MSKDQYEISVVSPVYNEEEVLEEFFRNVSGVLDKQGVDYEIVFVDDGSRDKSFDILKEIQRNHPDRVRVMVLTRNFGHQLAITAGIQEARGKAVIVMDSDLQDPPSVIISFIEKWRFGNDIVYGVRKERKGETPFKKLTAYLFYRLLRMSTKIEIPENVGDFYLLDRKVVDVLNGMGERHRFIRGLVAWVGYKRLGVEYVREPRFAGKTKYGILKMIKFSFDAATSFSFMPLHVISYLGLIFSVISCIGVMIIFYIKLCTQMNFQLGWASLMVVVLFLGGVQLLSVGVIGEYIARIGDDVKDRPLYLIRERLQ